MRGASEYPVGGACVGFRDIDSLHRLGAITLVQQAFSQVFQMLIQSDLQSLLIYSVDARCSCAT